MAIDDPLEKIREIVKSEDFDGIGAALQLGAIVSPLFKIVSTAKNIAAGYTSGEKVRIAIIALCDELQRIQADGRRTWRVNLILIGSNVQ